MNTIKLIIKFPRRRRRAAELYGEDSPFKPKVEKLKKHYSRKQKYRDVEFQHG